MPPEAPSQPPSPASSRDDVLHALYGAVGNNEAWSDALRVVASHFRANIAMLVVAGKGQRDQSFYAAWNHREEVARAYSDHWWQHDEMLMRGIARGFFRPGVVMRGTDVMPMSELRQTAYYRDFMRLMPAEYALACVLSDGTQLAPPMHLSLFRPEQARDFTRADVQRLIDLYPHLHRAFDLHWATRTAQEQTGMLHQLLDGMDFGIVFLDPAQRVLHANTWARQAGQHAGWQGVLGGLPQSVPVRGALADLLQATALGRGGALLLEHGRARLLALALPMEQSRANVAGSQRSSVALMLIDPGQRTDAAFGFVTHAFKLSPAEARLLPLLLENLAPADMATRLGLKISTVRSQLSSVFAKTGTARQQELIRLLGSLPAVRAA